MSNSDKVYECPRDRSNRSTFDELKTKKNLSVPEFFIRKSRKQIVPLEIKKRDDNKKGYVPTALKHIVHYDEESSDEPQVPSFKYRASIKPKKADTSVDLKSSPPEWFTEYMEQLKQDIATEISHQVMSNVKKYFDVHFQSMQFKNSEKEQQYKYEKIERGIQCNLPRAVHNSTNLATCGTEQEKLNALVNDVGTTNVEQKKFHLTLEVMDNTDISDIHTKVSTSTDTTNKQTICPTEETFVSNENTDINWYDKSASSNSLKGIENEFRMNCSVTEHDILNTVTRKDTTYCCDSDTDNISLCSNISTTMEIHETCNFEMVDMQQPKSVANSNSKETFALVKGKCLSFEILPEVSSFDEHHFSVDDKNTLDSKLNNTNCVAGGSCLFNMIKKPNNDSKQEADNTSLVESINGDFLHVSAQDNCQAQTDTNDLTQSFHSHIASVSDKKNAYVQCSMSNAAYNHKCCYNKHNMYDSKDELIVKEFPGKNSKRNNKNKDNIESPEHTIQRASSSDFSEPVHILPETLVTSAVHVASVAYDTALEALGKIRFNVKDERPVHVKRGWH